VAGPGKGDRDDGESELVLGEREGCSCSANTSLRRGKESNMEGKRVPRTKCQTHSP